MVRSLTQMEAPPIAGQVPNTQRVPRPSLTHRAPKALHSPRPQSALTMTSPASQWAVHDSMVRALVLSSTWR